MLPEWTDEDRAESALQRLLEDLAAAPLVPEHEINRIVDGGHFVWSTITKPWVLSEAQIDALQGLADGLTYKEIAARKGISKGTLQEHATRAKIRLRCRTIEQTIAVAVASGIVSSTVREPYGGRLRAREMTDDLKRLLVLIAKGKRNMEIVEELGISFETVKWDIRKIFDVLGARNRAHAVTIAFATGRLIYRTGKRTSA